jgi:protein-L-isoaspartate O-methyltransferase
MTNAQARNPESELNNDGIWKIDQILNFLDSRKTKTVLDVGCGPGSITALARASGAKVHAFDISPGLMNQTHKRMKRDGLEADIKALKNLGRDGADHIPAPKLWVGDASAAINFISGPYSAIVCIEGTLEFTKNPTRVLKLLMTALELNGRLFLEIENKQSPRHLRLLIKDFLNLELRSAVNRIKNTFSDKAISETKSFFSHNGAEKVLPVNLVSLGMVKNASRLNGCTIRAVAGNYSITRAFTKRSSGARLVSKLSALLVPVAYSSTYIWIEIEKIND